MIDASGALIRGNAIAVLSLLLVVAGCAGKPHRTTFGASNEPEQCHELRSTVLGVGAQAPFTHLPLETHHEVERLGDELRAVGCGETAETTRVFASTRLYLEKCAGRFSYPASAYFQMEVDADTTNQYFIAAGIDPKSKVAALRSAGVVELLQVMSGTVFRSARVDAAFRVREIKTPSVQGMVLKEADFDWFENRSASDLFDTYCG